MIKDLWLEWKMRRERGRLARAFLQHPHDHNDPECVLWRGDRAGMDWKARCPTCSPVPVHFSRNGLVIHLLVDPNPNMRATRNRDEVTCPTCVGILSEEQA